MTARTPEILLVDQGNTGTKLAAARGRRIRHLGEHPTAGITAGAVAKLAGTDRFAGAVVSSVAPAALDAVRNGIARRVDGSVYEVSPALELGVGIRYPRPAEIGADRLANAAGIVAVYRCPAVVVDFGTALTFDVIARDRAYVGGIIAPGLAALTRYLHQRTALLPEIDIGEPRRFVGRSTREAMRIGAVHGYRGMVRELLRGVLSEMGDPEPFVCATGGHARLLSRRIEEVHAVDPLLTLKGLAEIYRLQENGP